MPWWRATARWSTYRGARGIGGAAHARVVDRQGRETPIPVPPRGYVFPRLSPDGTRVAVFAQDRESDIWLWDLDRTRLTQATFEPGFDSFPVWTPDGRRLIFTSDRAGARNLFWQAADGTGAIERLSESPNGQAPVAVSPDGRRLIFTENFPKTSDDVMLMTLDGTRRVTPLLQSHSPSGTAWSHPTGQSEVHSAPCRALSASVHVRRRGEVEGDFEHFR
jgi:Tol biopolymer transport system component